MPSISEAVEASNNLNHSVFQNVERPTAPSLPAGDPIPRNMFLRCPLPPIASSPDSLRQFYGGNIPLTRLNPVVIK